MSGELVLLNRLTQEIKRHPGGIAPERCYSPATLAKEYFSAMGIKPPQEKFGIPNRINGIAMQAFVAGRAECTFRRTPVPVTYLDFHAQFPAAAGLKVAANSAAFGLLCQMDVRDLESPASLRVFSGEASYLTPPAKVWEQPADFCSPVIASLVTGGSHLLCAMLERAVRDKGGHIAAMDTDSAMIVSTRDGGLVPCAGGPHRLENYQGPGGNAASRRCPLPKWTASVSTSKRSTHGAIRSKPRFSSWKEKTSPRTAIATGCMHAASRRSCTACLTWTGTGC